jgi:predicted Ser/Thr protein kinase
MTDVKLCPECKAELPADAGEGFCPKCRVLHEVATALVAPATGTDDGLPAVRAPLTAPSPADLAPHFPQLEILELLGQGGMGAVYKARQPGLDRLVAIKVLPPEAGQDTAFTERFTREARALARLSHPNIITVYDFGVANGLYHFIMEYVDGVNLRQLVRAHLLQTPQVLKIVPQICDALQYAHEEKLVHRDIKPENILLDRKARVKVADFGIAKLLGRSNLDYTLTGPWQVMGTLHYMAPEQMDNPLGIDHRADIYSLGVVLYEMLTGQLPLGRFAPPSHKAGVDPRLDAVVLRALERDPTQRYQRVSELKTDVEKIAQEPVVGSGSGNRSQRTAAQAREILSVLPVAPAGVQGRGEQTAPLTGRAAHPTPRPLPEYLPAKTGGCWFTLGRMFTILACVLGITPLFLPWFHIQVDLTIEGRQRLASVKHGAFPWGLEAPGYRIWEGLCTAIPSFLLGCLLIATSYRSGLPRWRPLLVLAAALTFAIIAGYAITEHPFPRYDDEYQEVLIQLGIPGPSWYPLTDLKRKRAEGLIQFAAVPREGPYISLLFAALLFLAGTYELRYVLRDWSEHKNPQSRSS